MVKIGQENKGKSEDKSENILKLFKILPGLIVLFRRNKLGQIDQIAREFHDKSYPTLLQQGGVLRGGYLFAPCRLRRSHVRVDRNHPHADLLTDGS